MFGPKRARDTNTSTCLLESAVAPDRSGSAKRKLSRQRYRENQDQNNLSFSSTFLQSVKVAPCWFLRPDGCRSIRPGRGAMAGGLALATRRTDTYLSHLLITIHHLTSSSAAGEGKTQEKLKWGGRSFRSPQGKFQIQSVLSEGLWLHLDPPSCMIEPLPVVAHTVC